MYVIYFTFTNSQKEKIKHICVFTKGTHKKLNLFIYLIIKYRFLIARLRKGYCFGVGYTIEVIV